MLTGRVRVSSFPFPQGRCFVVLSPDNMCRKLKKLPRITSQLSVSIQIVLYLLQLGPGLLQLVSAVIKWDIAWPHWLTWKSWHSLLRSLIQNDGLLSDSSLCRRRPRRNLPPISGCLALCLAGWKAAPYNYRVESSPITAWPKGATCQAPGSLGHNNKHQQAFVFLCAFSLSSPQWLPALSGKQKGNMTWWDNATLL